jgi:hypothetical protein
LMRMGRSSESGARGQSGHQYELRPIGACLIAADRSLCQQYRRSFWLLYVLSVLLRTKKVLDDRTTRLRRPRRCRSSFSTARVHRIPPRVRDDSQRPFCGTGWLRTDLRLRKIRIFLSKSLTENSEIRKFYPSGKSVAGGRTGIGCAGSPQLCLPEVWATPTGPSTCPAVQRIGK